MEAPVISGYLVGDKQVVAGMKRLSPAISQALAETVDKLGVSLARRVVVGYLSGPRPGHLGRVTGRLASSIARGGSDTRSRFEQTGDVSTSYVGTNVPYGAAWERGFTKKVGAGARGGPRTLFRPSDIARYFAKHPPGQKAVPARVFLAPALQAMKPQIIAEIQKAVTAAAQGAMRR